MRLSSVCVPTDRSKCLLVRGDTNHGDKKAIQSLTSFILVANEDEDFTNKLNASVRVSTNRTIIKNNEIYFQNLTFYTCSNYLFIR